MLSLLSGHCVSAETRLSWSGRKRLWVAYVIAGRGGRDSLVTEELWAGGQPGTRHEACLPPPGTVPA